VTPFCLVHLNVFKIDIYIKLEIEFEVRDPPIRISAKPPALKVFVVIFFFALKKP